MGDVYGAKGEFSNTLNCLNQAIKLNPKDAYAYNNRAAAYYFLKDYAKSWEDVHKAESLGLKIKDKFIKFLCQASKDQECR